MNTDGFRVNGIFIVLSILPSLFSKPSSSKNSVDLAPFPIMELHNH
jgi:hypothetical protein